MATATFDAQFTTQVAKGFAELLTRSVVRIFSWNFSNHRHRTDYEDSFKRHSN